MVLPEKAKNVDFVPFFGYIFASTLHGLHNFLLTTAAWPLTFVLDAVLGVSLFEGFANSSRVSPYRLFAFSEWQTALEYIEYGLRRDPENPILNLRKGIYLAYSGAWPDALRCFQDAERLKPKSALFHAYAEAARIELDRGGSPDSLARFFSMLPRGAQKAFLSTMKSLSKRNGQSLKRAIEVIASAPKGREMAVSEEPARYSAASRDKLPADAPRKPRGI